LEDLSHTYSFGYNFKGRNRKEFSLQKGYRMLLEANVLKMLVNGDEWGTWRGYQLPVSDQYVTIWTPRGTRRHWKPHRWKPDFFLSENHSISYFWPGAWYTIHMAYREDGTFSDAYCDIVLPTPPYTSASRELIYTDLYIDVVVRDDYSVFTKDHAVYDRAAQRYPIVEESRQKAFEALDWVEEHAKHWTGPFTFMPRYLPRTDWEALTTEEIRAAMHSALNSQGQDDTRETS
jgi:protein associated with RNAse G/E